MLIKQALFFLASGSHGRICNMTARMGLVKAIVTVSWIFFKFCTHARSVLSTHSSPSGSAYKVGKGHR